MICQRTKGPVINISREDAIDTRQYLYTDQSHFGAKLIQNTESLASRIMTSGQWSVVEQRSRVALNTRGLNDKTWVGLILSSPKSDDNRGNRRVSSQIMSINSITTGRENGSGYGIMDNRLEWRVRKVSLLITECNVTIEREVCRLGTLQFIAVLLLSRNSCK